MTGLGCASATSYIEIRVPPSVPPSAIPRTLITFENEKGAYDQKDAADFIKLNALRLRTLDMRNRGK